VPSDRGCLGDDCPSLSAGSDEPIDNWDGLGLVRYGRLQVGQAARVPLGAAGAAHQPQEDLVADRTAGDYAGACRRPAPRPWVRCGRSCRSARWWR
jgi:hypothetical protein